MKFTRSLSTPISVMIATAIFSVPVVLTSCGGGHNGFSRAYLDEYIELEAKVDVKEHAMKPGISVYVDFSDGMNDAYGTQLSQEALRKVINVFTGAQKQADFFSLADSKITPLDLSQTDIYNAIMSGKNYTKPMAPIEETLKVITDKKQPALLITDFEEYHGGVIQQQNYAKDYFIDWLKKGYNIIFYKIDYKEGNKSKHLYFTVFDSPENELAAEVEKALAQYIGVGIDKFVLGGSACSYNVTTLYPNSMKGGNYHNSQGDDIVTAVLEDGKEEAFRKYEGSPYSPVVEYYPLGEKWEGIISNISSTQEEGMPVADRFTHFLSKIYVNFTVQDGYAINAVASEVYNFEPAIQKVIAEKDEANSKGNKLSLPKDMPDCKEVLDMFAVSMIPAKSKELQGDGWNEICVDLDTGFNGTIPALIDSPTDLLKINIVISDAMPRLDKINEFFAWPGNNSLAESVRNTLQSDDVNPKGRPIITYYLKVF